MTEDRVGMTDEAEARVTHREEETDIVDVDTDEAPEPEPTEEDQ